MTSIRSVYSDRLLTIEPDTAGDGLVNVIVQYPRGAAIGRETAGIVVEGTKLLAALGAEEAATPVLALAEARKQRDQARKAASDLKGVIDRSVVIDRADLPEVTTGNAGLFYVGGTAYLPEAAAHYREQAMRLLAVAVHQEAHPPVDQAQVDALADAIRSDPDLDPVEGPYAAAERLVRQGWSKL